MARTPKPKVTTVAAFDVKVAASPRPDPLGISPDEAAEATSATEGVAAPDVALAAPSVDGQDVVLSEDTAGAVVISDPAQVEFKPDPPEDAEPVACTVVSAIEHDGGAYAVGDPIHLDAGTADVLLRAGAVTREPT